MNIKERAQQLKIEIPAIFLCFKHPRTPLSAKILAGITLLYALSPIDFIPDFIPVLGYLDDLIILPVLIALTIKLVPRDVMEECRDQSRELWQTKSPKKWYFGLPVILFWLIVLYALARVFIHK